MWVEVTTPPKRWRIFRFKVYPWMSRDLHAFSGGFRGGATFKRKPLTPLSVVVQFWMFIFSGHVARAVLLSFDRLLNLTKVHSITGRFKIDASHSWPVQRSELFLF